MACHRFSEEISLAVCIGLRFIDDGRQGRKQASLVKTQAILRTRYRTQLSRGIVLFYHQTKKWRPVGSTGRHKKGGGGVVIGLLVEGFLPLRGYVITASAAAKPRTARNRLPEYATR